MAEKWSDSEKGLYSRLTGFFYHSTLGSRVMKEKEKVWGLPPPPLLGLIIFISGGLRTHACTLSLFLICGVLRASRALRRSRPSGRREVCVCVCVLGGGDGLEFTAPPPPRPHHRHKRRTSHARFASVCAPGWFRVCVWDQSSGLRVQGLGLGVKGLVFGVEGLGFGV